MQPAYSFYKYVIVRTPVLPLPGSFSEKHLEEAIRQKSFLEAVYIASPELYTEANAYLSGKELSPAKKQKLFSALQRYYTRMCSRCTPFGLFASCSVINWGNKGNIKVKDKPVRHTRLDMFYLCQLVNALQQKECIQQRLLYYPNNSGYTIGDEIRFIETVYTNKRRHYQCSAVSNSDYLQQVLMVAANGATIQQLTQCLLNYTDNETEAAAFVQAIIESQVVHPGWQPAITGKEYLWQVLEKLQQLNEQQPCDDITSIITTLRQIENILQQLDAQPVNDMELYIHLLQLVQQLGVPVEENKLIQVDAVQHTEAGSALNTAIQQTLGDGLFFLQSVCTPPKNEWLEQFKQKFIDKYDRREMPLTLVLDAETGIDYLPGISKQDSALTNDLLFGTPNTSGTSPIPAEDARWLKYLLEAQQNNSYSIRFTPDDIRALSVQSSALSFSPSFAVTFRLAEKNKVCIEHAGGSSAINMLSRFGYANPRIEETIKDIADKEQQQNPDVIFAEIVHLPESRSGNVMQHPPCRNYEIPYLASATVTDEFTIPVTDIWVSVVDDRVVLRSKKLNKEIIPRLSSAHNYSLSALPVYRFLCDIQTQGLCKGLHFSFGALERHFSFLPRVEYKNCIVHPATWMLIKKEYENLVNAADKDQMVALSEFCTKWNLPRMFILADGDNELLVNSTSEALVKMFIQAIKNRQGIMLKEFIGDVAAVHNASNHAFTAQFVAPVLNTDKVYTAVPVINLAAEKNIQRHFVPGSEWVYMKVYCGYKTADRILESVAKITNQLFNSKQIAQWFFIRYSDPQFHIRLRLRLNDVQQFGSVVQQMDKILEPFLNNHFISHIQLDTYEREIERYGEDTIELSESIFFHDSAAIVSLLQQAAEEEREMVRFLWATRGAQQWLQLPNYTEQQQLYFAQQQAAGFMHEFGADALAKKQLDKKYRQYKTIMDSMSDDVTQFPYINNILNEWRQSIEALVQPLVHSADAGFLNRFISSHIHMLVNRACMADARLHELLVYDFLSRYYQSVMARKRMVVKTLATA